MENIKEKLKQAVGFQEQGKFSVAEQIYQEILAGDSDNFEAFFFLGLLYLNQARYDMAIISLKKAVLIKQNDEEVHYYLGVVLLTQHKYKEAIIHLEIAIGLKPDYADAYFYIGILLYEVGKYKESELAYKKAISLKSENPTAYYNLAILLNLVGKTTEAEAYYKKAIVLNDKYGNAYNNLGDLLQKKGQFDDAVCCYKKAIDLNPDNAEFYYNLGIALQKKGMCNDAVESFKHAIKIQPESGKFYYYLGNAYLNQEMFDLAIKSYKKSLLLKNVSAEVYLNLGVSFQKLGKLDEAITYCSKAIDLKPDYAEAFHNLGIAFYDKGKLSKAIECYKQCLVVKPDFYEVYVSMGNAYKNMLKLDVAIQCFSMALTKKKEFRPARLNRALTWLLKGDYKEGWPEYEYRLKSKDYLRREFSFELWKGEDLNGRTLFVHSEQGLGDTMQFVRFLPLVKKKGGRIVFECQKKLLDLLKRCDGFDKIVGYDGDPVPSFHFDLHIPLLSLPKVLGCYCIDSIPNKVPYIFPDVSAVSKWKAEISSVGFNIGIVWAGNPKQGNDRNRSLSLSDLVVLSEVAGINLFSLQNGEVAKQLENPPKGLKIVDMDNNFDDTAAIIENLDLVITVDTAVGHLAGALDKPVWLLACYCPSWHLQLHRNDNVWYPTMRLFRQSSAGEWGGVLRQVVDELQKISACSV